VSSIKSHRPRDRRRPWYVYLLFTGIGIVGVAMLAMMALIMFFGLIAGW
jgi:hypothetical protein